MPILQKRRETRAGLMAGWSARGGDGPALVFQHCMLGARGSWGGAIEALPPIPYVNPDLPGHGATEYDADRAYLAQAVDLLATFAGDTGGPVHLIGHSFGGAIAAQVALAHPGLVASLFLYEPIMFGIAQDAGHPAFEDEVAFTREMLAIEAQGPAALARKFVSRWGQTPFDMLPERAQAALASRIHLIFESGASFHRPEMARMMLTDIPKIRCPITIVSGGMSPPVVGAIHELVLAHGRSVRGAVLSEAGHMGPITDPEAVAAEITAHIASVS